MDALPQLSYHVSPGRNKLHHLPPSFQNSDPDLNDTCKPSIVTLIGKKSKTIILESLLGGDRCLPVHKDVYLQSFPRLRSTHFPFLVIDCGIVSSAKSTNIPNPTTSWAFSKADEINAILYGQIYQPFSSVIYCFVGDLGSLKATTKWLANQAFSRPANHLPTLPRLLLVVETMSETFNERVTTNKALAYLSQAMNDTGRYETSIEIQNDIARYIGDINVLGLQSSKPTLIRSRALKRRLIALAETAMEERVDTFVQYSFAHFQALSKMALSSASEAYTAFNLAVASRPSGFSTDLLETSLGDFLKQLPSHSWLQHFAAQLIASTLFLASYPSSAYEFAPEFLFEELYSGSCKNAISSYSFDEAIQHRFRSSILREFQDLFMIRDSHGTRASTLHRQTLKTYHTHLAQFKSHRSCFSCFMRMPEKVLPCGHTLCDSCIRIFRDQSSSKRNTYVLLECILCGVNYQNSIFRFVPPTAGIRVLSVDGGGVRGIVPLMFLQHLNDALALFGCPVRDYFDFIYGTSAGGLVVIGLFLLQWGTKEAIRRFEQIAKETFGKRKAICARALQLVIGYVIDEQYSLAAVQDAFRKTFNSSFQMFNPLRNDTKVAVTTTAVNDSLPQLFTNYNGGKRPSDLGYDVVRAEEAQDDITLGNAACCTSAALWFFKPQAVESLGVFQDGGLQHNNPAGIAQWEARFLQPSKADSNFALSLGTGTSSAISDLKELTNSRFYIRLFKSLIRSLDDEDAWKRFFNSLRPEIRYKYHRLNIRFPGPEPSLDDAFQIPDLKANVLKTLQQDESAVNVVTNALTASLFYFELDGLPTPNQNSFSCSGFVFCRLNIPKPGLQYLYNQLITTSSWFLIQGNPTCCVQTIPRGLPPFRKRVTFQVKSLKELITFSIRGITSTTRSISGFPTTLAKVIEDQKLVSPFGTVEHFVAEKPLPSIPRKRYSISRSQSRDIKRARTDTL